MGRRLALAATVAFSLSAAATARADTITVSTETAAGTQRWAPSSPEDLYVSNISDGRAAERAPRRPPLLQFASPWGVFVPSVAGGSNARGHGFSALCTAPGRGTPLA